MAYTVNLALGKNVYSHGRLTCLWGRGEALLGAIALVTLIRCSTDDRPAAELIEQIRKAIESSKIAEDWSIEKISILGESTTLTPDLPQTAEKTHSHDD